MPRALLYLTSSHQQGKIAIAAIAETCKLCGIISADGPEEKRKLVVAGITSYLVSLILILTCIRISYMLYQTKTDVFGFVWRFLSVFQGKRKDVNEGDLRTDLFCVWNYEGNIVYEDIIEATEDFDSEYCIGTGGCASVYRVELLTGQVVAVKRVHSLQDGELVDLKSFENEIQVLANIRHRSIVKFYGFCSHSRHCFLIYQYMEMGSLASLLREVESARKLDWIKRIGVVKSVAFALSYLHNDCSSRIVHRDLSSNNVLLNNEFEAFVSDFGTARLLKPDSSDWTAVVGTYGYLAPELAYTTRATEKCDVYSFGVVSLEVIMGRHPREVVISAIACSSSQVYQSLLFKDIRDQRLPIPVGQALEEVDSIVRIAIKCLHPQPECRPTMKVVSEELANNALSSSQPNRDNY